MQKRFTKKQAELLGLFKHNRLRRLNILQGSVRSGKTWISLVLWAFWVASMPIDGQYLMSAKTITSLKRNCLDVLVGLVGERNFSYSIPGKQATLFGRHILLEGANDARSEAKIRGLTLQGAYCDELTLFPEDFFAMLLSRLSSPGAKLLATTNPDTPMHWLKAHYLDRQKDLDLLDIFFSLEDNTFLEREYVENLKKEYTGVFYERFVLGRWIVAEGAIYKIFTNNKQNYFIDTSKDGWKSKLDYDFVQIGVDFGGNDSAHTFVAVGITGNCHNLTALMSERHEAKDVSPDHLYDLLNAFIGRITAKYMAPDIIYADSAEQTLINGMRAHVGIPVRNSVKNPIIDRIRGTTMLMSGGRFFYTDDCKTLEKAFCEAIYDSKSLDDKRLDNGTSDIDTLDAFEYAWERYLKGYAGE